MRIWEKLFAILNIVFVFAHIFTFVDETSPGVSMMTAVYLSVFFWMMIMNYFFEGLKI